LLCAKFMNMAECDEDFSPLMTLPLTSHNSGLSPVMATLVS